MNLNNMVWYLIVITLITEVSSFNKLNVNKFSIVNAYLLVIYIIHKYNYSFTQISSYYQIVNYLNTKNNLLILMVITYLYLINKNSLKLSWVATFLLLVYLHNYDLIQINKEYYGYYFNTNNNLNVNLLNGIMLIHPLVLYTYYGIYISYIINICRYTKDVKIIVKKTNIYTMVAMILMSILLGCWWAEQELSWGGWWSWDLVELIALNFFLLSLIVAHSSSKNTTKEFFVSAKIYYVVFFSSLLFVRFNLINSIHNFLNSESQNQFLFYIHYTYVVYLIILLLLFICVNKYLFKKTLYINRVVLYLLLLSAQMYLVILSVLLLNIDYDLRLLYNMITLIVILYLTNNTFIKKMSFYLIFLVFTVLFLTKSTVYVNILIMALVMIIHIIFKKLENQTIKKLHVLIGVFFLISLYQTYLFNFSDSCEKTSHLVLIKINSIYNSACENTFYWYYFSCFDVKLNINLLSDVRYNTEFGLELFKNVFEKKIYICNSNLIELYNYNMQRLYQPMNHVMVFILILILYYIMYYIKYKTVSVWI